MTAQFADQLSYRGQDFAVAGANGAGLFTPEAYGLEVQSISSGCWRGYVAHYSVVDDSLSLIGLDVSLVGYSASDPASAPALFGVRPAAEPQPWRGLVYEGLSEPVPLTGGLVVGREFVRELYVHMGFHPFWKYRDVQELRFETGRLVAVRDRSEAAAARRSNLRADDLGPPDQDNRRAVRAWIGRTFELEYEPFD